MEKAHFDDTIVAISTPIGEGGIGIIRLSGKDSIAIADKIFKAKDAKSVFDYETFTTHYGLIMDGGNCIDEVIVTVMRAPRSYTKEDVVEINCHGGIAPLKKALELTVREGARIADPGEFTKRAFLNGRIDLIEAEAVLDIIKAKTDLSLKFAMRQLEGVLSKRIQLLKEKLLNVMAHIEAYIDFPEEDIEVTSDDEMVVNMDAVLRELELLIEEAQTGIILRDGLLAVICGTPNVGKSTLLNTLLKKERAIVTPIAGTTRDIIEESLNIKGVQIRLVDTAGITRTDNMVEKEGIVRAKQYIQEADIVIFLLDSSMPLQQDDLELANSLTILKNVVVVINKIDLKEQLDFGKVSDILPGRKVLRICAKDGTGIKELEEEILTLVLSGKIISTDDAIVTNVRHKEALVKTKDALTEARKDVLHKRGAELVSINVREALDAIGIIVGEVYTEDLLDRIFSQFCIGK